MDNAIQNVFVEKYKSLYDNAIELLQRFNMETRSSYVAAIPEDFQARVMRGEQTQDIPSSDDKEQMAEFLLPKILSETADVEVMRKVMEWISTVSK